MKDISGEVIMSSLAILGLAFLLGFLFIGWVIIEANHQPDNIEKWEE